MSRCLSPLPLLLALALGACGPGEPPPPEPALPPPPPPAAGDLEDEIFPHVSAQMPAEGLEPDGRMAPWSLGVQVGATLQALAEACGQHDAAELEQMRDRQRTAVVADGVDAERFDAVWTWAYRQARQKITMQPPEELERGCQSMHKLQQDAERMDAMMQPMALP